MRREYRFTGFGGQGVLTMGYIYGLAASVHEDYFTVQTQSYGPEARGGTSKSEVVIADREINHPTVSDTDVLLVMSQQAFDRYNSGVHESGIVLYDSSMVSVSEDKLESYKGRGITAVGAGATDLAETLGNKIIANIIMLGFLSGFDENISFESLKTAVLSVVPEKTRPLNEKALEEGRRLAGGGRNK